MTEQTNDQLSALMDGELPRDSLRFLLRRADADGEMAQRWSRYHVARACLRRQSDAGIGIDIAAAVMARIEHESVAVVTTRNGERWLRWAAGGAVAASVAVAALVVTRPAVSPSQPQTTKTIAAVEPARAAPVLQERVPAAMEQKVPAMAASLVDYSTPTASDPRLDSYLVRHYEATGQGMRSGLAPYVTLIVPSRAAQPAPVRAQEPAANAQ